MQARLLSSRFVPTFAIFPGLDQGREGRGEEPDREGDELDLEEREAVDVGLLRTVARPVFGAEDAGAWLTADTLRVLDGET